MSNLPLIDLTPQPVDKLTEELQSLRGAVEDQTQVLMALCEAMRKPDNKDRRN